MNFLLHTLQENGRSPLCNLICVFRPERVVNCFLHVSHKSVLFGMCVSMIAVSEMFLAYIAGETPFKSSESFHFTTLMSERCDTVLITRHIIFTGEIFLIYLAGIEAVLSV
jgi:hypothetical protein